MWRLVTPAENISMTIASTERRPRPLYTLLCSYAYAHYTLVSYICIKVMTFLPMVFAWFSISFYWLVKQFELTSIFDGALEERATSIPHGFHEVTRNRRRHYNGCIIVFVFAFAPCCCWADLKVLLDTEVTKSAPYLLNPGRPKLVQNRLPGHTSNISLQAI